MAPGGRKGGGGERSEEESDKMGQTRVQEKPVFSMSDPIPPKTFT